MKTTADLEKLQSTTSQAARCFRNPFS